MVLQFLSSTLRFSLRVLHRHYQSHTLAQRSRGRSEVSDEWMRSGQKYIIGWDKGSEPPVSDRTHLPPYPFRSLRPRGRRKGSVRREMGPNLHSSPHSVGPLRATRFATRMGRKGEVNRAWRTHHILTASLWLVPHLHSAVSKDMMSSLWSLRLSLVPVGPLRFPRITHSNRRGRARKGASPGSL